MSRPAVTTADPPLPVRTQSRQSASRNERRARNAALFFTAVALIMAAAALAIPDWFTVTSLDSGVTVKFGPGLISIDDVVCSK